MPTDTCAPVRGGVTALAHYHLDKGLDIGPDLGGAATNACGRPIGLDAMVCGYVIAGGGMLAMARRPLMRSNTLTFMINLDCTSRDAGPKLRSQKLVGH